MNIFKRGVYMKKLIFIIGLCVAFILPVHAASFKITSSTSKVAPNKTFTIKVGGDCIGKVNLKVTNGTLSKSSVWVEEGYESISVKAGSSGVVTVTATPEEGFSDSDANIYNPGSKSVKVNISTPSSSSEEKEDKPNNVDNSTPKKSGNNQLASLKVSAGVLSPTFESTKSEYTLELAKGSEEIIVEATAKDNKAKIEGIGKINLHPGNNEIKILVTAENNTSKTYLIKVYVEEEPEVFFNYNNKTIGVVKNLKGAIIPENFTVSNYTIKDKNISIFTKENIAIVYGINEEQVKSFYVLDKEKQEIISTFTPININNRILYVVDTKPKKENVFLEKISIQDTEVECYFLSKEEANYCVLNTLKEDGNFVEYLYETRENSVQLFPEFLNHMKTEENQKEANNLVLILVSLLELCVIIFLVFNRKKGSTYEKAK